MFVEISATAVVGDNLIADNGGDGLKINNSGDVQVWNNSFVGNNRTVWIVQDDRVPGSAPGVDPRQPFPDPTVPWTAGPVTVSDNVFSHPASASPCVLCVEDLTGRRTAEAMGIIADGNVYNRAVASTPAALVLWSGGADAARRFATIGDFTATTGQERSSRAADGVGVVGADGRAIRPDADIARPLPARVAGALGLPPGSREVGVVGR